MSKKAEEEQESALDLESLLVSDKSNKDEEESALKKGKGPISTLRFDVSFTVTDQKKKVKKILDNVHGVARTAETLAILGPSGAGKTTLLKVLTLDAFGGKAQGTVTLNGETITSDTFKKKCALVSQEDHHWAFLTCRETLDYAAALTLNLPLSERTEAVDQMIKKMGLEICADTRVGNAFLQGLSGGQKRRLSIGVALLKQPEVLYLDEPTSGLDAASASAIMSFITEITRRERLLSIFTIHQPSSLIYGQFDSLLLLSRGRVAYAGPRTQVVAYLDSIDAPLPPLTNPAEFLLDLVNPDFCDENTVKLILDKWVDSPIGGGLHKRNSSVMLQEIDKKAAAAVAESNSNSSSSSKSGGGGGVGLLRQIVIMFSRHGILTVRDPSLYTGRIAIFLMTTVFFAIIYIKARDRVQEEILSRMWFLLWCNGVPANMACVATFVYNQEYNAIRREVLNGQVKPSAYLLANTIIQLPAMFLFGLASLGVAIYAIGNFNPDHFGQMLLVYSLTMYAWESVAQMLSVAFENPLIGVLNFVQLWFSSFLFCGIFLPISQIVWPFRIFSYILPYQWTFRTIVRQEFIDNPEGLWGGATVCDPQTDTLCNFVPGRTGPTDGWKCGDGRGGLYNCYGAHGWQILETVKTTFGIFTSEDFFAQDVGIIIAIAVTFKIIYLVLMVVKCNQVSKLLPPVESVADVNVDAAGVDAGAGGGVAAAVQVSQAQVIPGSNDNNGVNDDLDIEMAPTWDEAPIETNVKA